MAHTRKHRRASQPSHKHRASRHLRKHRASRHTRKHRSMSHKSHTARVNYRQKAGGDWQSYCAACGKPLINRGLKGEIKKAAKWLNKNVGIDSVHDLIVNLGVDSMFGTCHILKAQSKVAKNKLAALDKAGVIEDISDFVLERETDFDPETQIGGIAVHSACWKILQRNGLDVNSCRDESKYKGQDYNWKLALSEDDVHYISPAENKQNERKLIENCSSS